jgi:hypothetical protein
MKKDRQDLKKTYGKNGTPGLLSIDEEKDHLSQTAIVIFSVMPCGCCVGFAIAGKVSDADLRDN